MDFWNSSNGRVILMYALYSLTYVIIFLVNANDFLLQALSASPALYPFFHSSHALLAAETPLASRSHMFSST